MRQKVGDCECVRKRRRRISPKAGFITMHLSSECRQRSCCQWRCGRELKSISILFSLLPSSLSVCSPPSLLLSLTLRARTVKHISMSVIALASPSVDGDTVQTRKVHYRFPQCDYLSLSPSRPVTCKPTHVPPHPPPPPHTHTQQPTKTVMGRALHHHHLSFCLSVTAAEQPTFRKRMCI